MWEPIPCHDEKVNLLTQGRSVHDASVLAIERQILRHLIDTFDIPSPKLIYTAPNFAHYSFWYRIAPKYPYPYTFARHNMNNPLARNFYMYAYNYAATVMLTMIDLILDNDPYAVIILQADHGFHVGHTQGYLRTSGMSDKYLFKLIHSTMSAVGIPERYGVLDAPIAPINITRELVNRFVGHNYELATPHSPLSEN